MHPLSSNARIISANELPPDSKKILRWVTIQRRISLGFIHELALIEDQAPNLGGVYLWGNIMMSPLLEGETISYTLEKESDYSFYDVPLFLVTVFLYPTVDEVIHSANKLFGVNSEKVDAQA